MGSKIRSEVKKVQKNNLLSFYLVILWNDCKGASGFGGLVSDQGFV